jgi:two-component system, NarL family, sensor histidine kinase UhpB
MKRPVVKRRDDSLIGQVVAANVLLVVLALFAASIAAGLDLTVADQRWEFLILALAIILTLCVNLWMLKRRFAPLERLIERVEAIDPDIPSSFLPTGDPVEEIDRVERSFKRVLDSIEAARRERGQLILRGQEEERRRLARDLHDEVNQALTAILLRLEALAQAAPERAPEVAELKRLVNQAMAELLSLARQLRPAALDDHGLAAAIDAQLKGFASRAGVEARFEAQGDPDVLDDDRQTAIYRVAQEALANVGRHSGAASVEVELAALEGGGAELRVRDDGRGFDPSQPRRGGLGLEGMAERARLVAGELDVRSAPGAGTQITLRIPS